MINLLSWSGFGIIVIFALNWFESRHLSSGLYGVVFAAASAAALIIELGLGELVSRVRAVTLRRTLMVISGVICLCCAVLSLFPGIPSGAAVFLYAVTAAGISIFPSPVNALGMAAVREGLKIDFGVSRSFGSLGFAVISLLIGLLVKKYGAAVIPVSYIIVSGLLFIFCAMFPDVGYSGETHERGQSTVMKDFSFLVLLGGCILLYICHSFLSNFMLKLAERVGGDAGTQGIATAVAAFSEVPVMMLFSKLRKRFGCSFLFILSSVFIGMRLLCSFISSSPAMLFAAQLCQAPGYALFTVASVSYVDSVMSEEDSVRAQAMLASSYTVSCILSYVLGGFGLESLPLDSLFLPGLAIAVLGALLIFISVRGRDKKMRSAT